MLLRFDIRCFGVLDFVLHIYLDYGRQLPERARLILFECEGTIAIMPPLLAVVVSFYGSLLVFGHVEIYFGDIACGCAGPVLSSLIRSDSLGLATTRIERELLSEDATRVGLMIFCCVLLIEFERENRGGLVRLQRLPWVS